MSHQDRMSKCISNHQTIKQVVDWLFPIGLFSGLKVRCGSKWKPRMLAVAALLWGGGEGSTLTGRFAQARKIVKKVFRWQVSPGETYQGFLKVLRKWHVCLLALIVPELRMRMEQEFSGCWRTAGFVVFAADGSRFELPRTKSNERAYSPGRRKRRKQKKTKAALKRREKQKQRHMAKKAAMKSQSAEAIAKKKNSPQLWLTLLWHVGCGLPWAWRTGPSDSSERDHVQQMLGELPENSLITADAGFIGFDFWRSIISSKRHFLIRVGGNVRLLKKLGYVREHNHTVYLWPDYAAKKDQAPLVLRLIVIHDGKQPVYLVTNLPKAQLSDSQAATIYARRWGIELFFRTFKQTFERRTLRSHAEGNCSMELDWSLLALWCVCMLGRREVEKSGRNGDRLSAAKAIQAFRQCLREYRVRPETSDTSLLSQMRSALLDEYKRKSSKASRNYPRQKKRERVGPPKITLATKQQIQQAKQLQQQLSEIRLSA